MPLRHLTIIWGWWQKLKLLHIQPLKHSATSLHKAQTACANGQKIHQTDANISYAKCDKIEGEKKKSKKLVGL